MPRRLLEDERIRFLIVGGFNTVFGYLAFAALELTVGRYLGYLFSLYASFLIASVVAFALHRRHTFRVHGTGNVLVDFLRFISVYVVALALNTIALPLLVEAVGMSPLVAQALIVVVTTVTSYFGHKYFSFRRRGVARHPEGQDGRPQASSALEEQTDAPSTADRLP